jgi:dissimilatory sulfite reductase related protein
MQMLDPLTEGFAPLNRPLTGQEMQALLEMAFAVLGSLEGHLSQTLELLGRTFALDKDGHLAQRTEWSRAIARELAFKEGIDELTEQHWTVIDFMRSVYEREGAPPPIRRITKESGVDTKGLYQLFPGGPGKKAAKIAGLPKPKSCI